MSDWYSKSCDNDDYGSSPQPAEPDQWVDGEPKNLFDRPVSWNIAKTSIPAILEMMGDNLLHVQKVLRKAQESSKEYVDIYMMPDEAQEIWSFFEAVRLQNALENEGLENAASIEDGTEVDL